MRLVVAAAAAVLLMDGATAQPVSTAPLARNELLLEVDSQGEAQSRADRIFAMVRLTGAGTTAAEARAALERKRQAVLNAARSLGVPDNGVRRARLGGAFGFVGNEAMGTMTAGSAGDAHRESLVLEVDLRDADQFGRLQAAIEGDDDASVIGPLYALTDDAAARRVARSDALARARADADAYARSLGMRVARIVRVSERASGDMMSQTMQAMIQSMAGLMGAPEPEIETEIRLSVDFALTPQ